MQESWEFCLHGLNEGSAGSVRLNTGETVGSWVRRLDPETYYFTPLGADRPKIIAKFIEGFHQGIASWHEDQKIGLLRSHNLKVALILEKRPMSGSS